MYPLWQAQIKSPALLLLKFYWTKKLAVVLKIVHVKYPITGKNITSKHSEKISGSPRGGLSVSDRLKGHRDTWGGLNHLEKRGLRGSSHTYWEMTENIWDHSQTHMYSHTPRTFTHILWETHTAIKLILNLGSNTATGCTSTRSGAERCL